MLQNQYSSHLDFISWPLNPKSDAFPFVRYVFIEVNTQNCTWPHFISNNYFLIKSPNVDQFCLLCLRSDCHIVTSLYQLLLEKVDVQWTSAA